jgi:glutamine synthetase
MLREELIFVATCDIPGHVRGKAFPARELEARLEKVVGWTPTNLMISALGPIWYTPFGTASDLMSVPDRSAEVRVDFGDGSAPEHFFIGDILTSLDEALDALERTAPAHDWFGRAHFDAYLHAKRAESANAKTLTPAILCERYAEAY